MKKKTQNEFLQEVASANPNITVLGLYVDNQTKVLYRCNVCGNESSVVSYMLTKPYKCPLCIKEKKLDCIVEANSIKRIDRYQNQSTPIGFECKQCGHTWKVSPKIIRLFSAKILNN